MDGLLSKTASDAINIASFVTGILSLAVGLVALALTYYSRPKRGFKISRDEAWTVTSPLRTADFAIIQLKLKRFLYAEGALAFASVGVFLPVGPTRDFLAIPFFLLWLAQGILATDLLLATTKEAFDNSGAWRYWYTASLSTILLATTLVLWSGATTPLREFLGLQLILPAVMSGCALVAYVAWLIFEVLNSYSTLKKNRKLTLRKSTAKDFYQEQVEKLSRKGSSKG